MAEPISPTQEPSQVDASKALTGALNKTVEFQHSNMLLSIVEHMTSSLEQRVTERTKYYNELSKIRDTYLVNGIYDIVSSDVFLNSGTESCIKIEVPDDKDLEAELIDLFEDLNVADLLQSTFGDLLHYGSYSLRPVTKRGQGLVALSDDFHPSEVLAITEPNNLPLFYFISDNRSAAQPERHGYLDYSKRVKFNYADITQLVYFSLDLDHLKLDLPAKFIQQFKAKLPPEELEKVGQFPSGFKIKQSKSFIWGAIDKIRESLLLEKVSTYKTVAQALSPTLVGIPVPDMYDPDSLIAIVRKYDELINGGTAKLNSLDNPDFILQDISNVKVIPIAGDRSVPQPVDTGASERVIDPEVLDRSLQKALNTLSIPVELYIGAGDPKENRKNNVRYAKKIKRIQKNMCRTLTSLALLHIGTKYPDRDVGFSEIKISLKNNTNTDELENLESQDLILASISSSQEAFTNLQTLLNGTEYSIDVAEFAEKAKEVLESIGSPFSSVIKKTSEIQNGVQITPPLAHENVPDQ